jgi:hypothetical protein
MKVQKIINETRFEDIDIELPIYAYFQNCDEMTEEWVKIDEKGFNRITCSPFEVNLYSNQSRNPIKIQIQERFLKHPTTPEHWEEAWFSALTMLNSMDNK